MRYLPDDGEARVQVGEPAGRQAAAARGELQEGLALAPRHLHQHVHQPQEPGAAGAATHILSKTTFVLISIGNIYLIENYIHNENTKNMDLLF